MAKPEGVRIVIDSVETAVEPTHVGVDKDGIDGWEIHIPDGFDQARGDNVLIGVLPVKTSLMLANYPTLRRLRNHREERQ